MGITTSASVLALAMALPAAFPTAAAAAFRFFDPEDRTAVPALLSATGFYDDIAAKRVTAGAVAFEVNTPLWSDGASKRRWVVLKPGTRIRFSEAGDYYGYPDGAVFVKEFSLDTVPGDASSRRLWETRLLVNRKDAEGKDVWHGFSYRWDRQGREARLVNPDSGLRDAVRYWPEGRGKPSKMKKWTFPSQDQCTRCHLRSFTDTPTRAVLGFFTAQLNRELPAGGGNQLKRFFDIGLFEPLSPLPDFARAPRWAALGDASASLELRARSYLAANCSGCHGDRGIVNGGTSGMCAVNFDFHDMKRPEELGDKRVGALEYQYTSHGDPENRDSNHIVTPKHPEFSSIIWRQAKLNAQAPPADTAAWLYDGAFDFGTQGEMPPLGRYEADTTALKVISAWIDSLPERVVGVFRGVRGGAASRPWVAGGEIRFAPGAGLPARAWLVDTRGTRILLEGAGPGRFRLPRGAAPGVHLLVAGGGRSYRILLP